MNDISETPRFNKSAVCFITGGAIAKRAMTAKYPLAPPCPTEAYKKAIMANKMISSTLFTKG